MRYCGFLTLVLGTIACAYVSTRSPADVEAILSRGGGLSGIVETVSISSTNGELRGIFKTNKESRARSIRLPRTTLDSTLVEIESLVTAPPQIPPETGGVRRLCGDPILRRIEVRRGSEVQSAQEECPHRTIASEVYWQQVDSLFQILSSKAL